MEDFHTSLGTEIQLFAEQQERQQKARGLYPKKLDIYRLRTIHRLNYYSMQNTVSDKNEIQLQTTSSNKAFASRTPLKYLIRTKIQDLCLEIRAKGKYLLLRTLEPCYMMVGIHTIVEDHTGNATTFCAYNMVTEAKEDCQEIFPVGTVFALKEPYYKVPRTGDYLLRCDSPTDIVFVHQRQDYFNLTDGISWKNAPEFNLYPDAEFWQQKTALEWKALGNEMYQKRKFLHATRCYTRGLWEAKKASDGGDLCKTLHLNLAQAYLSSRWCESAIRAAEKVLTLDPSNEKAYFRAGRANYELRKYKDAMLCYSRLLDHNPDCKEAQTELKRCESRILEAETGNHDVFRLYLEDACRPKQPVDCADYIGPVKVVSISGKGRGIVATKDLDPGTVLVVSKAVKMAWTEQHKNVVGLQFNTDKSADRLETLVLVSSLANQIRKNPDTFGSALYDLSVGVHESAVVSPAKVYCDPDSKDEVIVDIERIRHIVTTNSFGPPSINDNMNGFDVEVETYTKTGSGLFLFPSFFNHHCLANAFPRVYNDVMVVRTVQPVKEGEEISLSYFSWELRYAQRKDMCQNWGFQCDCQLCLLDEKEPLKCRLQRQALMETFLNEIKPQVKQLINGSIVGQLKRMIKDIKATYKKAERKEFRVDLFWVHQWLGLVYHKLGLNAQAVLEHHNAIRVLGFEPGEMLGTFKSSGTIRVDKSTFLNDFMTCAIGALIKCCQQINDTETAKTWTQILIKLEHILSGADQKMMKRKFAHISSSLL